MRNFVGFEMRPRLVLPVAFVAMIAVICVILIRKKDHYVHTPPVLVGTYVAHYENVTQKLTIKPGGIYEQAISIGNRNLTNRGRWSVVPGLSSNNVLSLKHSLIDEVAMGGSAGNFIYGDNQMLIERDNFGHTTIGISEDLDLFLRRQ